MWMRCRCMAARPMRENASKSSIKRVIRRAAFCTVSTWRRSSALSLSAADASSSDTYEWMCRSGMRRSCDTE